MTKIYFPDSSSVRFVEASSPHPPNTQYKISLGLEAWEDGNHEVVKIQMVYNDVIAGRRSPSYPSGSSDFQKVAEAVHQLLGSR